MNDLYRVRADGGTPMTVSADRYTSEFFAAPSPDGQRVAFTARGNSAGQWWRKGHSHLDESELWLLHDGRDAALRAAHRARRQADVADVERRRARACTTCPIAAARRTSGRCRLGGSRHDRSRGSTTAACCGRRSPTTAGRSSSSATSRSGRSTPPAAKRARCRSRSAALPAIAGARALSR